MRSQGTRSQTNVIGIQIDPDLAGGRRDQENGLVRGDPAIGEKAMVVQRLDVLFPIAHPPASDEQDGVRGSFGSPAEIFLDLSRSLPAVAINQKLTCGRAAIPGFLPSQPPSPFGKDLLQLRIGVHILDGQNLYRAAGACGRPRSRGRRNRVETVPIPTRRAAWRTTGGYERAAANPESQPVL